MRHSVKQIKPPATSGQVPTGQVSGPVLWSEPALNGPMLGHSGDSSTSTTNTTEPNQFGDAGILLPRYRLVYASSIIGARRVRKLVLKATCTVKNSSAGGTSNVKFGVRMQGVATVRWTAAQSVTGTTAEKKYFSLDLMEWLSDFTDGNFFFCIGAWGDNPTTTTIGSTSVSEPNPHSYVVLEVGD